MTFSKFLTGRNRAASAIAALALLTSAAFAQTVDGKPEIKTQVLDRVTTLLTHQAYVPGLDFEKWKDFAESEKAKLDESKDDDEFARAVNEALTKFGASHIYFATPRSADTRLNARMVGIGINPMKVDEGTLIMRTVPGAPADKAGLKPGDIILKVDGQPVDGIKGIAGPEGTKVVLTVKHTDGKVKDHTLTRATFSTVRKEELTEVDKNTARLSIYTFDLTYDRQNVEQLMLKAQKYPNLILDLRDNGGGAVVNLQHLLGLLVPANTTVGTFVNRQLANDYVEKTGGKETDVTKIADWSRAQDEWFEQQIRPIKNRNVDTYKGHVAVLVNQFSGSASEICAAALRDTIGAEVVGTKSAGAVLVSVIVPATNGFTLQYPISDYVTVKGLRIEGNGVVPTLVVEDPKIRMVGVPDPVVTKAAESMAKVARESSKSGS